MFLTSAGRMSSAVYRTGYNVSSYFNLREINDDLNRQNAELQAELVGLRRHILQLEEEMYTDTMVVDSGVRRSISSLPMSPTTAFTVRSTI